MGTDKSYTTIGAAFDHIIEMHQKSGKECTLPVALEDMRHKGLLQPTQPRLPPYQFNMTHEEFCAFIRAMPISADSVIKHENISQNTRILYEPGLFPQGKDVFCFLNMPYMEKQLHFHDFFEITYVVEGSCTFLFEGETASLRTGDVCITSPMAGHSLSQDAGCVALSIVVRKSTFNPLFSSLLMNQDLLSMFFRNSLYENRRTNYIKFRTGNNESLFITVQMLTYECNLTDDFANTCGASLLNLFLARLLRVAADITLHHYESYSQRDFDFTLLLQYIQQKYRTVTLASLADTFHFSKPYLSDLIHKNMGRSFTEILRSVKMRYALDFLMNTPMKVSEISDAVGYDSVDHFSRTFRREYGMSPKQYKQCHRPNGKSE